ncbi:hypothetical protein SAMN05216577_111149 [Pseudomonas citronellolis]|uniref:Uncharacterized protein n=1 Tax=Pseudomonas citronellolis TaxID=53408 RepID=A0AAQ1HN51_9PSED|nr:hypothetical protein SAMN05216577_111149 [Pseudomonas citronellolis]
MIPAQQLHDLDRRDAEPDKVSAGSLPWHAGQSQELLP